MVNLDTNKIKAIRAVKVDGRLIADVATEFGISSCILYRWLSENSKTSSARRSEYHVVDTVVVSLKSKLKLLQTEVQLLKSELVQYQITESLENGKLVLSFELLPVDNTNLKKAS